MNIIKTDILIIGGGPTGLFAVFEAGLLGLKCHIIDALTKPGGQCSEIYPKKPIFDIPGIPEILAGKLIEDLLEQIKPFSPGYTLSESAEKLEKKEDGSFNVVTNKGTVHNAKVIAIAGGLGSFEPRKPQINDLEKFEGKGLEYMIKDPETFKNKNVVISGGGDSALDWTIELEKLAKKVTLIHRRTEFRGAVDSVDKVQKLKNKSLIDVITPAEVIALNGNDNLKSIKIKTRNIEKEIMPSNPRKRELKKLNFSFPAFLSGLSYSIPVCLNPAHDLSPLINKFFSLKFTIMSQIFFFIKQNSPTCEGM